MDFHAMKRKKLQSLSKKHGIPANLKNKEMADRLSFIFNKGKENQVVSCQLGSDKAAEIIDLVSPSPGFEKTLSFTEERVDVVAFEEFGSDLDEHCDVRGTEKDVAEVEEQHDANRNSPNGLNKNVLNVLPDSTEEFGHHLVEEVLRSDGEKINLIRELSPPDQILPTYAQTEVKSSDIHKIVTTSAKNADSCEMKFLSSQKKSLSPEERVAASPELTKNSEIKRSELKTNLSPERRDDEIANFYKKENSQKSVSKDQNDGNKEALPSEASVLVMEDESTIKIASEEPDNCLMEEEVEKFCCKTNVHEDICGTGKCGAEVEKQDDNNSPQDSKMNNVNILHVSPEESGDHVAEGESHKLDNNICVHGSVSNVRSCGSEAAKMFLDASMSTAKANVIDEHFLDEAYSSSFNGSDWTPVQPLPTYSPSEVKSSELSIRETVVSGTATKNEDTREAKFISSGEKSLSPASERINGFPPKLSSNSDSKVMQSETNFSPEAPRFDIGICDVEDNMQIDVIKEQAKNCLEVLDAALSVTFMNDDNLEKVVASEELGNHLMGEDVEKLSDRTNEALEQGDHNSPRGSNVNDLNILHVSQEESGYPLEEVQKSDDDLCLVDTSISAMDIDEKTNVAMESFTVDVHSSSIKYSDGTPDQFLKSYPLRELKSGSLNIHQMVASDTSKEKLISSQKTGQIADPIGFSPKNLEAFEIKGLQAETYSERSTVEDVIGIPHLKESKQSENMEIENAIITNSVDLNQRSMEEFCTMQVQVTGLFDNHDVHDDAGEMGAEEEKENGIYKLQASDIEGLQAKTYCYPSILGDVIGISNMTESMQSEKMETENVFITNNVDFHQRSMEECYTMQVEVIGLFDNHDVHDDAGGKGAEEEKEKEIQASDIEVLQAETYSDPSTLGNVVETSNITESMQSEKMETENAIITNNVDLLQRSMEESYTIQGEVTGLFDKQNVHEDNGGIGDEENESYIVSPKRLKREMDTHEKYFSNEFRSLDNGSGQNSEKKADEYVPNVSKPNEMKSCTSNLHQNFASDASEEKLKLSQKSGQITDPKECIKISHSDNLEPSKITGFQAEADFNTCNGKVSMESDKTDEEYIHDVSDSAKNVAVTKNVNLPQSSMEECNSVPREVTAYLYNHDYDDAGGIRTEEEENETYMVSSKRFKREVDTLEKSFVNESQPDEMKLCTSNPHENFTSDSAASGDEVSFQEKLGSPPKCTSMASSEESLRFFPKFLGSSVKKNETNFPLKPTRNVLGTCDMKENMKSAKKEQVGTITSKKTFSKRQPLQDLQQNRTLEFGE